MNTKTQSEAAEIIKDNFPGVNKKVSLLLLLNMPMVFIYTITMISAIWIFLRG